MPGKVAGVVKCALLAMQVHRKKLPPQKRLVGETPCGGFFYLYTFEFSCKSRGKIQKDINSTRIFSFLGFFFVSLRVILDVEY